jgi:signal transduction protein with GAF and PtsI domain
MTESQKEAGGYGTDRIEECLSGLLEISNLVGSVLELNVILDQICAITARMFRATVCSIYLLEGRNDHLILRANHGLGPEFKECVGVAQLPAGHGLPGISFQTNQLIVVPDASQDPRHETVYGDKDDQHHAYICNPLRIQWK